MHPSSRPKLTDEEGALDTPVVYLLLVILAVGVVFAVLHARANRSVSGGWSEWCRHHGVPDVPFDYTAAAREVVAGTRPGIPRDGQWWVAHGIEQVGRRSMTRLFDENALPDLDTVHGVISNVFGDHRRTAEEGRHFADSHVVTTMPSVHRDIIVARITGRYRPIGGWLVAVPPRLIGSK